MEIETSFSSLEPLRQGDLIARSNSENRHPFDRFGVVVTADCDLERARPDHQITLLRIVPVAEFVHHVWCRKKIHAFMRKLQTDTADMFNRLSRTVEPDRLLITPERLIEWLTSTSSNEICHSLPGLEPAVLNRLQNHLDQLASAVATATLEDGAPALEALISLRMRQEPMTAEKVREDIIKQAKNELAKESDEVFFLSQLVPDENSEGYYVLLDHISAIRRDRVFDYKSEADSIQDGAHRFGSLEKTFKYAVVQRFAFLFQRIGLPDERIDWHRGALQKIA